MDLETELLKINLSILGLSPGANLEDVQGAYRSLMKKWHPDLHMGSEQANRQASELTKGINAAYAWIVSNRSLLDSICKEQNYTRETIILVDKFLFGEGWCEEEDIDRPIDLIKGVNPQFATRLTQALKVIPVLECMAASRNYRYFWCDALTGKRGQAIRSRVDFKQRHVFVNMSLEPRIKVTFMTGALIFFRDLFCYGRTVDKKLFLSALKAAGWSGGELFTSKPYFETELLVCGEFSGRTLLTDRAANAEPEGPVERWVNDFSANWFPNSLADYSRSLANRFRYDAPRSLAYPFPVAAS